MRNRRQAFGPHVRLLRVIRGQIALTAVATNTASISPAVDPANTILVYQGNTSNDTSGDNARRAMCRLELNAAGDTVTAIRNDAVNNVPACGYELWEFAPGAFERIVRGTITLNAVTTNTAALSPAAPEDRTVLVPVGIEPQTGATETADHRQTRVFLTSGGASVTAERVTGTGINIAGYQAVTFMSRGVL